jgi:hypothetical protein
VPGIPAGSQGIEGISESHACFCMYPDELSTDARKKLRHETSALSGAMSKILSPLSAPRPGAPILAGMTQAQGPAYGVAIPSLSQLLLAAMLLVLAELVSSVAATFGMIGVLLSRDWHTKVEPAGLPLKAHDPTQETEPAAPNSQTTTSSDSAAVLLPRAGEALSAPAVERQRPGGGRLPRSTVKAVPHRIALAGRPAHASLPRSGEESRTRFTS